MIDHGVPFDVAHSMGPWELLSYAVTFAKFKNGNMEWDWDGMSFVERR